MDNIDENSGNVWEDIFGSRIHQIWSHWMKYIFSMCQKDKNGNVIIPKEKVDLWYYQMITDYKDLSEKEKESDKDVYRKFLKDL